MSELEALQNNLLKTAERTWYQIRTNGTGLGKLVRDANDLQAYLGLEELEECADKLCGLTQAIKAIKKEPNHAE